MRERIRQYRRTALALLVVACLASSTARQEHLALAAITSTLDRPSDPVVLTGANVLSLQGAAPASLVAYRFTGGLWTRVHLQVDERDVRDLGQVFCNPQTSGFTALCYTDPNTCTGPDSNPLLDGDDEIVFMAVDAGERSTAQAAPAPGLSRGLEVRITDPRSAAAAGYVYLFESASVPAPLAPLVTYDFSFVSGAAYQQVYATGHGTHPEQSSVATSFYKVTFADRWINDGLYLADPSSGVFGPNLLDGHKVRFEAGNCARTEYTFSGYNINSGVPAPGTFIASRSGPVRAIRSHMGANSGTLTQRDHFFYQQRQDVVTTVRVHPIPGLLDYFDYTSSASGMSYFRKLRNGPVPTQGVLVDGQQDTVAQGALEWEMIAHPSTGTVVIAHASETDMGPAIQMGSYYIDQVPAGVDQCQANDTLAFAQSGPTVVPATAGGKIPCTNPLRFGVPNANCESLFRLELTRHIYYRRPGTVVTPAQAQELHDQARMGLEFTVQSWPARSDTVGIFVDPNVFFLKNSNASGAADLAFAFGSSVAGWVPVAGDWDGDGTDTIGLYDPANGAFFLRNSNGPGPADLTFGFGSAASAWVPVAGDWDGNGTDTIGLYDPANGAFFLRNENAGGPANVVFFFGSGASGGVPVAGDWDGNGTDTIGLYDPANGAFFLRDSNASGPADTVFIFGVGGQGWRPATGDWDGDGDDTVGLYVPGSGFFFVRYENASGPADLGFGFGPPGATPLTGDWDGL